MAKILALPLKPPSKFGFEKAKKRRKKDPENLGQMNMFTESSDSARIVRLPSQFTPFEEALQFDELNDPRAKEAYLKAIEQNDYAADAFCNLGIIESKAGHNHAAFDCFTRSIKEDPRHLESHYNLANLYFDIGNLALAREHYEMAAKLDPDFPNIYFNLGIVHALNQDYKSAFAVLSRYKELVSADEAHKAKDLLLNLKKSLSN